MSLGYILKIHKTYNNQYNFIQTFLRSKNKYRSIHDFKHYDYKLDSSLSRARSTIFNLTMYNEFTFFYTQTISSKFNREDLNLLIFKFRNILKYLRKLFPNKEFKYVIVPEYHLDNKCWHVHGFLNKAFEDLIYINKNGFPSLHYLDNIGFNNIEYIRNFNACCKYFCKYVTKDLIKSRGVGERVYYCSRGLKRENLVFSNQSFEIAPIHFDFKSPYVFKSIVDENKYYNFITKIDNINYYNYI